MGLKQTWQPSLPVASGVQPFPKAKRHAMFVHIRLAKQTQESMARFEKALRIHPEIRECYAIAGNVDYYLTIDVEDIGECEGLRKNVLCRLPGVLTVKVNIPLRKVEI